MRKAIRPIVAKRQTTAAAMIAIKMPIDKPGDDDDYKQRRG